MNRLKSWFKWAIKGCLNCGAGNPDSTNYCYQCGAPLG